MSQTSIRGTADSVNVASQDALAFWMLLVSIAASLLLLVLGEREIAFVPAFVGGLAVCSVLYSLRARLQQRE